MIGLTLSHYRITAELGEGGMGQVYRARDTSLDREVAIKVLPDAYSADPERVARFEREAKFLASLNHANIAQIYGFEEVEGKRLLVMELVPGETLKERLERGPLPLEEIVPIARQIADALEAAHEMDVIHRDLKPANLKIEPSGKVKILDFGLAKGLHPERGAHRSEVDDSESPTLTADLTRIGTLLGTSAYMSPEQVKGQQADRRADIWAFGVVLWEMLTGQRLFRGETTSEVLASVLHQPIEDDAIAPATPRILRLLLDRCLDRDPRSRLRDIGEARVALAALANDRGGMSLLPAAQSHAVSAAPTRSVFSAWVTAAAALAAVLVAFLLLRPSTSTQDLPVLVANLLPPAGSTIDIFGGLALSADGRRIAFVVEDEVGHRTICVQSLDREECRSLSGTERGDYPFWSPDGRHLGFFADGSLLRIDGEGGPARVLAPIVSARGGAWCTGDRIVYAPDALGGLLMIPAEGGEPEELTILDAERGERSHRHPSCMPSGEAILMLAQTAEGGSREDESRIEWVSLDTGDRRAVLQANSSMAYTPSGYLFYWREGTLLAVPMNTSGPAITGEPRPVASDVEYTAGEHALFAVATNGTLTYIEHNPARIRSRLQRVDLRGSPLAEASPADRHTRFALNRDGRKVAYRGSDFTSLWIRDLVRGTASRLTLKDGDHTSPVWSRREDRIFFATDREGSYEIYRQRPTAPESEELIFRSDRDTRPDDLSPDGKSLSATVRNSGGDTGIALLDIERGQLQVLVDTAFTERSGYFSPDGEWLAYVSDESGEPQIYVISTDGGGERYRVSVEGGEHPRWSPDGDRVYYFSPTSDLMAVDVDLGETVVIGAARTLFEIERPAPLGSPYAVHPDGESFVLNRCDVPRIPDHITLVQNWMSRLR